MSDLAQAALISGFFAVIVIIAQAVVARMNTRQHGMVDDKVDRLGKDMSDALTRIDRVRDDVRDLDGKFDGLKVDDSRRHEENLVHLERHDQQLASIDEHVTSVDSHVALVDRAVEDLTERVGALEPPGGNE